MCSLLAVHCPLPAARCTVLGGSVLGCCAANPDEYCKKHRAELPPLICLMVEKNKVTGLQSKCADAMLVISNPLMQKVLTGDVVTIADIKDKPGERFCDCFASQLPIHAVCKTLPAGQDDCKMGASTVRELLQACVQNYHGCDYALQKDDHTKTCVEATEEYKARNGTMVDGCGKVVGTTNPKAIGKHATLCSLGLVDDLGI